MAGSFFPEPRSRSSGSGKDLYRPVPPPARSSRLVVPGLSLLAAALGTGFGFFLHSRIAEADRASHEATLQSQLSAEMDRLKEEARLRKAGSARRTDELAAQLSDTAARLKELDDSRNDLQARLAAAEASQQEALQRMAAAEQRHRNAEIARSAEVFRAEQAQIYAEREARSQRIIDQQVADSLRRQEELRDPVLQTLPWVDEDAGLYSLRDELVSLRETAGVRYPQVTTVVSRVENEVTAAEARLASLNSEIFQLDQQCRQIEEQRHHLAIRVQQLEQENKKLSTKVEDLSCQLDVLTGKKPASALPGNAAGSTAPASGQGTTPAAPAPAAPAGGNQ